MYFGATRDVHERQARAFRLGGQAGNTRSPSEITKPLETRQPPPNADAALLDQIETTRKLNCEALLDVLG